MEYYKIFSLESLYVVVDGIHYTEEWRWIPGYEGHYQVSSFGRIKSFKKGIVKIRKQHKDDKGYLVITFSMDCKPSAAKVHRLVMLAFKGDSTLYVDHIKEIKTYNCIWNLQYLNNRANVTKSIQVNRELPTGVLLHGKRYSAKIVVNGVQVPLGCFDTPEEASDKYQVALADIENIEKHRVAKRLSKYGRGVYMDPYGKFVARIPGGKQIGRFPTAVAAREALEDHHEKQKPSQ